MIYAKGMCVLLLIRTVWMKLSYQTVKLWKNVFQIPECNILQMVLFAARQWTARTKWQEPTRWTTRSTPLQSLILPSLLSFVLDMLRAWSHRSSDRNWWLVSSSLKRSTQRNLTLATGRRRQVRVASSPLWYRPCTNSCWTHRWSSQHMLMKIKSSYWQFVGGGLLWWTAWLKYFL